LIGFDAKKMKPAVYHSGKLFVPQDQELHHPAGIAVDDDFQYLLMDVGIIGWTGVPAEHVMCDQFGRKPLFEILQLCPEQGPG
jgi:hypothetical protein